jgi:hypothetical protein
MSKQPKFLIAKNPMATPDNIYIFHTQKPRFLAQIENSSFEIIDDIDNMIDYYKGDITKVQGLTKRMTEWYKAYKIHENGNRRIHREN